MNTRRSLPLRIPTNRCRRIGPYTLDIYGTGSSVFVDVIHHVGSDSLLLASMAIGPNGPIIMSRYSGSKVVLVDQLEMEEGIAHVPRVRL